MINKVVIQGRFTANPELKTTPNGISVCSFTLANNTGYGENQKTNFINCVAWRKTAEFVSKYFHKGDMAIISGELQIRKYEDKNGKTNTFTEIIVEQVEFCGGKTEKDPLQEFEKSVEEKPDFSAVEDCDLPF